MASPLFASLSGLPPLLVQVGTADLLLSDSERLAAAAAEAGVDVTLEIGEGLPRVYPIMLGPPEAAKATERIEKFLRSLVRQANQLERNTVMNYQLEVVVLPVTDMARAKSCYHGR